jgi:hypothetical protein
MTSNMDAAGTPDPPPNVSYASAIAVDADTPRGGSADPRNLEGILNTMHVSSADPRNLEGILNTMHVSMQIKSYHKSKETDMDVDAAPGSLRRMRESTTLLAARLRSALSRLQGESWLPC